MKYRQSRLVATATLAGTAALFALAGVYRDHRRNPARVRASAGHTKPGRAGLPPRRHPLTNNPDVIMLSSSYAEAGTEVIVGVGPQRARWRCIGYRDGTTADIMSLTDEGAL